MKSAWTFLSPSEMQPANLIESTFWRGRCQNWLIRANSAIRSASMSPAWDVLGWGRINDRRWFLENQEPILFDIDLDYFAIKWEDYVVPWPEEIFEREFLEHSKQYTTIGRTSQEFFLGLLGRSAL